MDDVARNRQLQLLRQFRRIPSGRITGRHTSFRCIRRNSRLRRAGVNRTVGASEVDGQGRRGD